MSELTGQRIRKAREREGLTQAALADKVGVAPASVSVWEAGGGVSEGNKKTLEKILGPIFSKKREELALISDTEVSSFGLWLRDQRSRARFSVPELAAVAGVSAPAIYNIESGKIKNPQASTRNKLAKALNQSVPDQVVKDTEQGQAVTGLGNLTDFEPHSKNEWPQCAGVYVLYDISERPIYVGKGDKIAKRLNEHYEKFWFKSPVVQYASYIEVKDTQLRHQLEQAMIKFLKSNAVINKQSTENFSEE
ncbi:MAG TPA: helix-turn-helix domain-containing protein [Acetobacteraceae bacterium]